MVQLSSSVPELQRRLTYLCLALHEDELSEVRRRAAAPYFEALALSPETPATTHSESTNRQVLSMIADLYGVDRGYLTDRDSDPQRDIRITDQLEEICRDPYRAHLFQPASARTSISSLVEQVEIVTSLGRDATRRLYWRIAAFALPVVGLVALSLLVLLAAPGISSELKGACGILFCAALVYTGYQMLRDARAVTRALGLDPGTFEFAYHRHVRLHLAEHLGDYLTETDLTYDELYAVLRNNSLIPLSVFGAPVSQ